MVGRGLAPSVQQQMLSDSPPARRLRLRGEVDGFRTIVGTEDGLQVPTNSREPPAMFQRDAPGVVLSAKSYP